MAKNIPPFFIVGCGRSGTSLLRAILNNHPHVAVPLESLFTIDYLVVQDQYSLEMLKDLMVGEPELVEWGLNLTPDTLEHCTSVVETIRYVHELYANQHGTKYWGAKTPRFVRYLDLLKDNFPDANFIHIIRDPRAVANSLIRSNVHRSDAYHAAKRWNMDVGAGMLFETNAPDCTFRVKYENLVADPEGTLRQLLDFLGLDFLPSVQDTQLSGTSEYSAFYRDIHANLENRVSTKHVDKWRDQLTLTDIQVVESITKDLMIDLSYPISETSLSPIDVRIRTYRTKRAFNSIRQILRYIRHRPRYLFYIVWRKWRLGLLKDFLWGINY